MSGPGFIERHGLWSDEQQEAAERVRALVAELGLQQVRISWGDQHGIVRGKTLTIPEFQRSLAEGKDFQFVTSIFDTTNHPIVSPFAAGNFDGVPEADGLPDGLLVPDPTTFRVLPWVEKTGWLLSDAYFQSGREHPFSTRGVLRRQLAALAAAGYDSLVGLEIEFYVLRLEDPMLSTEHSGYPPEPPRVTALSHGFQYLTESRNDEIDDLLRTLQGHMVGLELPLLTMEDEWGPGQIEFTFSPEPALRAADNALLFRAAVKQICRRLGYHATFMARLVFPEFFGTGWHLHESLVDRSTGENAFSDPTGSSRLTSVGMAFLGGLLDHACPASVFTTPTITGYKRYRPDSFAPDRTTWAVENRAAMVRVLGEPGTRSVHLENRIGDPAANPYLYVASQIASGLDGIRRGLDPGPPSEEPYRADATPLPASLIEAVAELKADRFFRDAFGEIFVDYIVRLKEFELRRFLQHVSDWEHREYFEMY